MDTKALRQKILDLAVRGKLVPQDPNDEPASVLLERIREQKQQMVKDGKLKKKDIKNDSVIFVGEDNLHYEKFADGTVKCIEDEIPFELPDGWAWTRFSAITINRDSERKPISSAQRTDVAKIYDYYGASGKIDKIDRYIFNERLLLIGEDGANLVTRSKPIAFFAEGQYWVNNHAHCIDSTDKFILEYLCFYINAISLEKYVTGSAQPKMTQDNMNSILIPLPPYNEQKRMSQHLNEMMSIIDNIENEKEDALELVSKAKSTILDLAIRGKLVPQNPDDEPASVLLERIRTEKEELIKQGKIKRDKKKSIIFKGEDSSYYEKFSDGKCRSIEDELPFELPDGWEWCNLSMIGTTNIGLTYRPTDIDPNGTMVLRSSNIVNDEIDLNDLVRVKAKIRENQYVHPNDILICVRNGSRALVGKCTLIGELKESVSFGAFMAVYKTDYYKYVLHYLRSNQFRNVFDDGNSTAINQLTQDMLKRALIPFPPISEQERIVDRISELLSRLHDIEKSLS